MNIELRFTHSYYYAGAEQLETLAGTLTMSVGGGVMFSWSKE